MKIEISVPEVVNVFKEIQNQPQKIFEMVRIEVQEMVGRYLTEMMNAELTHFLGRDVYERKDGDPNYRNGSYDRGFTLKGIGKVSVKVPRDRNGEYQTQVINAVDLGILHFLPPPRAPFIGRFFGYSGP